MSVPGGGPKVERRAPRRRVRPKADICGKLELFRLSWVCTDVSQCMPTRPRRIKRDWVFMNTATTYWQTDDCAGSSMFFSTLHKTPWTDEARLAPKPFLVASRARRAWKRSPR